MDLDLDTDLLMDEMQLSLLPLLLSLSLSMVINRLDLDLTLELKLALLLPLLRVLLFGLPDMLLKWVLGQLVKLQWVHPHCPSHLEDMKLGERKLGLDLDLSMGH
jgi:hypothetical protein